MRIFVLLLMPIQFFSLCFSSTSSVSSVVNAFFRAIEHPTTVNLLPMQSSE